MLCWGVWGFRVVLGFVDLLFVCCSDVYGA